MEVPTSYYQLHRAHPTTSQQTRAFGWVYHGELHLTMGLCIHRKHSNTLLLSEGESEPAQTKFPAHDAITSRGQEEKDGGEKMAH